MVKQRKSSLRRVSQQLPPLNEATNVPPIEQELPEMVKKRKAPVRRVSQQPPPLIEATYVPPIEQELPEMAKQRKAHLRSMSQQPPPLNEATDVPPIEQELPKMVKRRKASVRRVPQQPPPLNEETYVSPLEQELREMVKQRKTPLRRVSQQPPPLNEATDVPPIEKELPEMIKQRKASLRRASQQPSLLNEATYVSPLEQELREMVKQRKAPLRRLSQQPPPLNEATDVPPIEQELSEMVKQRKAPLRRVSQQSPPLHEATYVPAIEQELPEMVKQKKASLRRLSQQPLPLNEATDVPLIEQEVLEMVKQRKAPVRRVSQQSSPLNEATDVPPFEHELPAILKKRRVPLRLVSQQPPPAEEARHLSPQEQHKSLPDVPPRDNVSGSIASQMSNPKRNGILDVMDNSERNEGMPITSIMMNPRKKPRGPARNVAIAHIKKGETYSVVVIGGDAVGNHSQYFHSQMGILARLIFPIWAHDFRVDVTMEMKVAFLEKLGETFTWDQTLRTNKLILSHAAELLRTKRHRIKREHFNPNIPITELLANVPEDLHVDEWKRLIDYWTSPKYKAMEERNKKNRSKLKEAATHHMGRKNYNQLKHDLEAKGIDVNRPSLFLHSKSREGPNGSRVWRDATYKKQYELMMQLSSQIEGQDPTTILTPDAAFLQATGSERPSRVRGVGRGITPSEYYGRSIHSNNAQLTGKVDRLEKKLEEQTDLIKKLMEIITNQQGSTLTQRPSASRASDGDDFNGINENEFEDEDELEDLYWDG